MESSSLIGEFLSRIMGNVVLHREFGMYIMFYVTSEKISMETMNGIFAYCCESPVLHEKSDIYMACGTDAYVERS